MGATKKWVTRGAGSHFGNSGTDYVKGPLPASNTKSTGLAEGEASKRPVLAQRTRERRGTRVLCTGKAWASPRGFAFVVEIAGASAPCDGFKVDLDKH